MSWTICRWRAVIVGIVLFRVSYMVGEANAARGLPIDRRE